MRRWIIIALLSPVFSGLYAQSLDDYLAEASENNPGLKARYAAFEAALQGSARAAQMPNPTLSFGYFIQPVETRVGPQQARIGLSQMFPWFGTLKSRSDAAAFLAEAKYYEFIDARESLYASVKQVYYRLFENYRLVKIEDANLGILNTLKELSLSKYENGKGSLADVYRADLMIDESQTRLQVIREQRSVWVTEFNGLLNRSTVGNINVEDSLVFPSDTNLNASTPGFSNHPVQQSIAELQKSFEALEHAAKRSGYPSIGLGLDYLIVGERTDATVPDNGRDALLPMVSVSLPIYRKGYKAARTEAQKMQDSYAAQSLEVENTLEIKWEKARFALLEAGANLELLERQIAKTETIIELLLSDYSSDALDFEVLLREQQKLLEYQRKQARALVNGYTALAQLDYLNAQSNENE